MGELAYASVAALWGGSKPLGFQIDRCPSMVGGDAMVMKNAHHFIAKTAR
jgi:hypothetical protein